ncbi:hypothetical protein LPJ38_26885 [Bradyrhizobium daqingense]|uniref:HNH endonuclease n=1 Tax=Bradyrhizobium daqingense TaxID=993502 RepID=A0A562LML0_9BRAD|nr:hypothetical protein [Bradyrhizobium daqingense]TWI08838.1 hypothetical protein IQ17_01662 [Bradyrhizobium daqingense]UFS87253.1 hypothetical protein LPJ38_26885 [Bradyrhizobium daqingense]
MGENKLKRRAHAAVLDGCPCCIYCGGDVHATSVDHVPPIIMFEQRRRPKGLEFGSCDACNGGTRRADLVAAMIGRSMPDSKTDAGRKEMKNIFSGIDNNIPGLLEEMYLPREMQSAAGWRKQDGGLLRVDGPLVSSHMQTFAFKIGFSLYYEMTKRVLPKAGGVVARWFSNFDRLSGAFPQDVFEHLLPSNTLRQGKFEVSDQFEYQWRFAEEDRMAMFLAIFRQSFAVIAFAAVDRSLFDVETKHAFEICAPGELTKLLNARAHASPRGAAD